ncbi:MAG TPA: hypothetical protein VKP65_25935, partial [Rhodothermales bacterium]|nr:hypothetical protein [Rhodothermales bacterium]
MARYADALPINLRRPGYPEDLIVTFADMPLDTSRAAIGAPGIPVNFKVETAESDMQLDFNFRDVNGDATLSAEGEFIEVLAPDPTSDTGRQRPVWRILLDEDQTTPVDPPGAGDVYRLALNLPFSAEDAFSFTVRGEYVDETLAQSAFDEQEPYVVPNPYVASASFEPERFAVAGRGERRLEFRAIPSGAMIRIYSVRGELVQTLRHDDSTTGMVPWDLRSKDNLEVAPGLYVYHVDAGSLGEFVGKFAIIK